MDSDSIVRGIVDEACKVKEKFEQDRDAHYFLLHFGTVFVTASQHYPHLPNPSIPVSIDDAPASTEGRDILTYEKDAYVRWFHDGHAIVAAFNAHFMSLFLQLEAYLNTAEHTHPSTEELPALVMISLFAQ